MSDEKLTTAHQVFGIPELLGKILYYALYNDENELCRKNLLNILETVKSWNKAAKQVLQKNKEPLHKVQMTNANSLSNGKQRFRKILKIFSEFRSTREEEEDAYFALEMEEGVFRLENQEQLQTFLETWGHFLVELKIKVPENGGSLHGLFLNTLELPELRKLKITMSGKALDNLSAAETLAISPGNSTLLLLALINRRPALKELILSGSIPTDIQFIQLPESLTKLSITCLEKNQATVFRCLARNPLPNLRDLELIHSLPEKAPPQVAQELLYSIFQNLGKSLQSLDLHEHDCVQSEYLGPRGPVLNLRFPVMRSLEQLDIWGIHSELNSRILSISSVFPRLNSLILWGHTETMVSKWTTSVPVPLVTTLELELMQEENGHTDVIPVETINNVHLTYPNVTDLYLVHCGTKFDALQYVFREMRQLRRLTFEVMDTEEVKTSHHWDSLLVGASLEFVEALAVMPPQFRGKVLLKDDNTPSIRMLSELTFLWLDAHLVQDLDPMISDLTFIHALNGMSKLEHVRLRGRFMASQEIVEKWEMQGRKVDYKESK